jgi:plastocyanin
MTALIAGVIVVVGVLAQAVVGPSAFGGTGGWPIGPGMMSGRGMGPGMMGFGASGPASSAIPNAPEVRVQVANFSFTPSETRLPKGTDVNLTFTNSAGTGVVHDLTVPALGIHIVANPGETRTVGLRGLAAGRYDAYCSVSGHADLGMRAMVIVE